MIKLKHLLKAGKNKNLIISLHGTGGSVDDLFSILSFVDREATLLGIEGRILENGLKRYFKRSSDGSFDLESLKTETDNLYENIMYLIKEYNLEDYNLTIAGYSNGANIIISLLKEYSFKNINVLLLHPSLGFKDQDLLKQENVKALLTSGKNDPFICESDLEYLKAQINKSNIKLDFLIHTQGHSIINDEIQYIKKYYAENIKQ